MVDPSEKSKSLCSISRSYMGMVNRIDVIPVAKNILGWNKCELIS